MVMGVPFVGIYLGWPGADEMGSTGFAFNGPTLFCMLARTTQPGPIAAHPSPAQTQRHARRCSDVRTSCGRRKGGEAGSPFTRPASKLRGARGEPVSASTLILTSGMGTGTYRMASAQCLHLVFRRGRQSGDACEHRGQSTRFCLISSLGKPHGYEVWPDGNASGCVHQP